MKDIDFLPLRFRERHRLRRAMVWHVVTVVALAMTVIAAQMMQVVRQKSIDAQLAAIDDEFSQAETTSSRLAGLQTDLQAWAQFAELYTYLEHPWPRTQLLAAVARMLPPKVALTDVRIEQRSQSRRTPPPKTTENSDQLPAAVRDLRVLREEMDGSIAEIVVRGLALEMDALHEYVAGFTRSPFFSTAKLDSIESLKDRTGSRFELRLLVRPGYGQPGGPDMPWRGQPDASRTASRFGKVTP